MKIRRTIAPKRTTYRREGEEPVGAVSDRDGQRMEQRRYRPLGDQALSPALSASTVSPVSPTSAKPPLTRIFSGWAPEVR